MRLARDVEHHALLVGTLAVDGAGPDVDGAGGDLDAIEAAEDEEELGHHVRRDAEGRDHLERGEVELRRVVAVLEEALRWRLGDRLVLGCLLLRGRQHAHMYSPLRQQLLPVTLALRSQLRLHLHQLLLGCVGARALLVGRVSSRCLRLGCGLRRAGLLLRCGCALVGVAGVLQAPLVESAALGERLDRSAELPHLLEHPRLAGAAHSRERNLELRHARGKVLGGGGRLVALLVHTLLVDAQLGHSGADALERVLLRQVERALELGRVLYLRRLELLQEGLEPSVFRGGA